MASSNTQSDTTPKATSSHGQAKPEYLRPALQFFPSLEKLRPSSPATASSDGEASPSLSPLVERFKTMHLSDDGKPKNPQENDRIPVFASVSSSPLNSPKSTDSWDVVSPGDATVVLSVQERLELPPGSPPNGNETSFRFDDEGAIYLPEDETWCFDWRHSDWQITEFTGPILHEIYNFEETYPWMAPVVRYIHRYPSGLLSKEHAVGRAKEAYRSALGALIKAMDAGKVIADEVKYAAKALRDLVEQKWPEWGDTVVDMLGEAVDVRRRRTTHNRWF